MNTIASSTDITDATFASQVLDESHRRLVVVDFWAPWCGPCRAIGPVLANLATEADGTWMLAKLNVDENPQTAARYGIQSIPAVKAFKDGAVVHEFVGALPEAQIRRWLEALLPGPADAELELASAALTRQDAAEARAHFEQALAMLPGNADAVVGLATLCLDANDPRRAQELLDSLRSEARQQRAAEVLFLSLRARAAIAGPEDELKTRLAANPTDGEARIALAWHLAARSAHAEALEQLLGVVAEHHRDPLGERARLAMLEIFEVTGNRSPITSEFRSKLANTLYR